jgi:hypothetical protein
MELNITSEVASCSATQEFTNILWYPMIHYRVHSSPPLIPILSQINPVHTTPSYISKICFNISSNLRLGLPNGLILSGFPPKSYMHSTSSPCVLRALPISSSLT